jgi:hypothetical protein
MISRLSLAAGLVAAAVMFAPLTASATPIAPQGDALAAAVEEGTVVEKTQWWGRCHDWRRICARRWGWDTPRYFWCLRRHAC